MKKKLMHLQVFSLVGKLFDDQVESVYLAGYDGEFELLPFHHAIVAALPEGPLCIANHDGFYIQRGVVLMKNNHCRILVEVEEMEH